MESDNKKISISTRFHSWVENDYSAHLDLNELLVAHPAATFFIRVKGDAFLESNIGSGDILVVDRSLKPSNNRIVIVRLDGQLIVRKVIIYSSAMVLISDNPNQKPITITADMDCEIWGVVTYVIHQA